MRIRKYARQMLGSIAQPEAPQVVLGSPPPPSTPTPTPYTAPTDSNTPTVASGVVSMLNRGPLDLDALDSKQDELNDAPWRVPRTMPGIAYEKKNKKKGKEVEKDVLSYKVDNHFGLPEKANDGKWRCKKNDGKKWLCKRATDECNTLCEYHLGTENSSVEPKEEVLGANAKSAAVKALATSKSAQVRASTNLKLAPMKTSARSKSSVASGSKATSSAIKLPSSSQPRKKKKVGNDWSEEPFLYYDLHTPFRTKRRGSYDNNNGIVEDAANVEKCPQVVTDAGARGQDRPSAEALYMDDIGEISEGDEESDEDYCAPGIGNSEIHAKNGERKVFLPDLNGPKVGTKRL